jgi:hypothetical protein
MKIVFSLNKANPRTKLSLIETKSIGLLSLASLKTDSVFLHPNKIMENCLTLKLQKNFSLKKKKVMRIIMMLQFRKQNPK